MATRKKSKAEQIAELARINPNISTIDIMKAVGASRRHVNHVLQEIAQEKATDAKKDKRVEEAHERKRIESASCGCPTPEYKNVRIESLVKNFPFMSDAEIARRSKATVSYVVSHIKAMRREGFYRGLEREIQLEEYFDRRPTATNEDAAKHFKVPIWQIMYTLRGYEWDADRTELPWENDTAIDEDMWNRRCMRPEWYVEEVCGAGYIGIQLPKDEFQLYLELREKKKSKGHYPSLLPTIFDVEDDEEDREGGVWT